MEFHAKRARRALFAPLATALMASALALPAIAQETMVMEDTITIGDRLTRDGRVAIYGIYFDSDKADLKPESDPVLDAIGQLLADNPDLELAIIGHTDITGPHEHNLDLSKIRANAVVNAIVGRHGIERGRLYPAGAGFLVPIARNNTEEGKALNRRVELVRMAVIRGEEVPVPIMRASTEPDPIAENAKMMVKAMSDYLGASNAIKFDFNASLEVVTTQDQKLALTSSGEILIERSGKLYANRHGGFANVEMVYDGQMLSVLGKDRNAYVQAEMTGTLDELINALRDDYGLPLPGADLLLSNVYDELMPEVIDIRDLGSGVINGKECDHLAFRTDQVDWQLWIAQGDEPHPCRYTITTRAVEGLPQYTIELSNWQAGAEMVTDRFTFNVPEGATKLEPGDLNDFDELPPNMRPES
ncbi:MAG: DUF2092 domain-containing protein [Hyphomicrobiales bacterium]|nr:DUF2092 domain-containing protein [Hyphomicrobiales bacterium]